MFEFLQVSIALADVVRGQPASVPHGLALIGFVAVFAGLFTLVVLVPCWHFIELLFSRHNEVFGHATQGKSPYQTRGIQDKKLLPMDLISTHSAPFEHYGSQPRRTEPEPVLAHLAGLNDRVEASPARDKSVKSNLDHPKAEPLHIKTHERAGSSSADTEDFQGMLVSLQLLDEPSPLEPEKFIAYRAVAGEKLKKALKGVDAGVLATDDLYNAAAIAGRLKFSWLATAYQVAAFKQDSKPIYEVRALRHTVESGQFQQLSDTEAYKAAGRIVSSADEAYRRMLELVYTAEAPNCELIYSEAWNIAEHLRKYRPLITAFEELATKGYLTSYAHVIAAQLYAREGAVGWRTYMEQQTELAKEKLSAESPMATWYNSSQRELKQLVERLSNPDVRLADEREPIMKDLSRHPASNVRDLRQFRDVLEMLQRTAQN